MKNLSKAALCAAVLFCAGAASANPPVEAFGSLPFITNPILSPDGKYFAAIQPLDGRPAAVIYQVNAPAGSVPSVLSSKEWIVEGISWVKPGQLVVKTKSELGKYTWHRAIAINAVTGAAAELLANTHSIDFNIGTIAIADKDLDDPDLIYMPMWTAAENGRLDSDPGAHITGAGDFTYTLYRVNVNTGHADRALSGTHMDSVWYMDGHGHVVARTELSHQPLIETVRAYDDGDWRDLEAVDASGDRGAGIAGVTLDGKSLAYFSSRDDTPRYGLRAISLADGNKSETLFADPTYDVAYSLSDEWTRRVTGVAYAADKMEFHYFDPEREAVQRGVEAVFPGLSAQTVSATQDLKTMLIAVDGPQQPPSYYFLDRTTHQATKIASEYPDLIATDLGAVRPYPYKARDGLDIPAYLTIPPGRTASNLPLVVMPHGGPDARDMIGFDWWAQFLANRGYAVFQPNYRGSNGYGRAFTDAGLKQWGLKMQDDITDGVKKLIADGVADPKRICIVGGSYGGYAALAGATFTPDLYACAASFAGVSDLGAMLGRTQGQSGRNSSDLSFWISRIGNISNDAAQIAATSPALHADQVKIPILLMHGENDTTVPIEQSEEERDALEKAGKSVKYVSFKTDDHYFSLAATRIGMLRELEAFLAKNIGN
jgi:dipeptidyl aminopeptidase/acylaminoacyl peptidase